MSNDLKCAWGSAPDPAWGAYDAPPDPLIASGFAPKALAPRPMRRLKADPPSFFWANITLSSSSSQLPVTTATCIAMTQFHPFTSLEYTVYVDAAMVGLHVYPHKA